MKVKTKVKLAILLGCLVFLWFKAGTFLVIDEPPQKADVIVVLAGDRGARMEKAAELFHSGYAPYLILSGTTVYQNTTAAELMAKHAVELGIPIDRIILETKADSTYQNAVYSRELIEKNGFNSAIVVSSNYHMRRVKLSFDRVFKGEGKTIVYCAANDPGFVQDRWWASNKSIIVVLNEYIKLIGYGLGFSN